MLPLIATYVQATYDEKMCWYYKINGILMLQKSNF